MRENTEGLLPAFSVAPSTFRSTMGSSSAQHPATKTMYICKCTLGEYPLITGPGLTGDVCIWPEAREALLSSAGCDAASGL